MTTWENCPDDILINLFKNFDLKSRVKASQTCQNWNRLLKDPHTKMEDVYEVKFTNSNSAISDNQLEITMNALAHVGKMERLVVKQPCQAIARRAMEMINDGRLRIDNLITNVRGLIEPTFLCTIRELVLNFEVKTANCILIDCPQLPNLERLTLGQVFMDPSSITLSSLKYFHQRFPFMVDYSHQLNTVLDRLPSLKELRVSWYRFINQSFEIFLSTIQNKLPNLESLYFDFRGAFRLDLVKYRDAFFLSSLKKMGFKSISLDIIRLFIRITDLDTIQIEEPIGRGATLEDIYHLTMTTRKKTEINLELTSEYFLDADPFLVSSITLAAFDQMLTKLTLRGALLLASVNRLIDGGSYRKLTEINFELPIDDGTLKIISQSCLVLRKLRIKNSIGITEAGLKWFLINWQERQSKQLSIECINSISIDGLFGTSIKEEKGILDEKWSKGEEDETGGPSVENEKRWMIYQKLFPASDTTTSRTGTRLIIWDQGDSYGFNQKILVIKNYDQERLDTFKEVAI